MSVSGFGGNVSDIAVIVAVKTVATIADPGDGASADDIIIIDVTNGYVARASRSSSTFTQERLSNITSSSGSLTFGVQSMTNFDGTYDVAVYMR